MNLYSFYNCTNNIFCTEMIGTCKFCVWALIIAITVSVAVCQLPTREFQSLEKMFVET